MGKGIITSNEGEGLYLIDYVYNITQIDTRISQLQENIVTINTVDIPRLEDLLAASWIVFNEAVAEVNLAIAEERSSEEIQVVVESRQRASNDVDRTEKLVASKRAEAASIEMRIDLLETTRKEKVGVSAWCTDYTTEIPIDTEVGVMEFPGESPGISKPVIIQPGTETEDNYLYNSGRDGLMTQGMALTSSMSFYWLALFTGWQRWVPLYRLADVTSVDIDAGTVNIVFQNTLSSYQDLPTISDGELSQTGVEVDYMGIGADAFEVGDSVVVEVTKVDYFNYTYKVIGFEKEPRIVGFEVRITFITSEEGNPVISGLSLKMKDEQNVPAEDIIPLASDDKEDRGKPWLSIGDWEPVEVLPQWISGIIRKEFMETVTTKAVKYLRMKAFHDDGLNVPIDFTIEYRDGGDDWQTIREVINWRNNEVFHGLNGVQWFGEPGITVSGYYASIKVTDTTDGDDPETELRISFLIQDSEGTDLAGRVQTITVGEYIKINFNFSEGGSILDPPEPVTYRVLPQTGPKPTSWEVSALVVPFTDGALITPDEMVLIDKQTDVEIDPDPQYWDFVET